MKPQLLDVPRQIDTKRMVLRCYREGEGAKLFDLIQRNIEHFRIAVPPEWLTMQETDDGEVLVREFISAWYMRRAFFFSMWHRENDTLLGHIPLFDPDWDVPRIEIGYILGQEYQGQGYMTEGARACVRFAFDQLAMHKVLLYCRDDNTRSYRLAERVGFVREGLQPNHIARSDGPPVGRLCYGMTRADYERLAPTWDTA
jgi:RimJ/RimL family protein N-acetyltransferase